MTNRAKGIGQIIGPVRLVFRHSSEAIQIGVGAVAQHLGQTAIQVESVGRRLSVGSLLKNISRIVIMIEIKVKQNNHYSLFQR